MQLAEQNRLLGSEGEKHTASPNSALLAIQSVFLYIRHKESAERAPTAIWRHIY